MEVVETNRVKILGLVNEEDLNPEVESISGFLLLVDIITSLS